MHRLLVITILFTCAFLPGCVSKESNNGGKPVVYLMDDHSDAFIAWAGNHVKNRTVIHVDAHDDFKFVDEAKVRETHSLLSSNKTEEIARRLNVGESELMNIGNFIYVASKVGMVRDVYWIYSSAPTKDRNLLNWVKWLLVSNGFPRREIDETFKYENGIAVGAVYGTRFSVCSLGDLPSFPAPVLLDIDIDFFPNLVKEYPQLSLEDHLGRFREDLLKSGLRYDVVTIAHSLHLNFTPMEYVFIGEAIKQLVENPQVPLSDDSWKVFRQRSRADFLFRQGHTAEAIKETRAILKNNPRDAQANYTLAYLSATRGNYDEALKHAEEAARLDRRFFRGLAVLGNILSEKDYAVAMKFVDKADKIAPGEKYISQVRGDIYYNKGEYRKSIIEYLKSIEDNVAVNMYIGDNYMQLKEYDNAMKYYEMGIRKIEQSTFIKMDLFAPSLLMIGEHFEKVKKDPRTAKKYFDRYLAIPRNDQEQRQAYLTVREKSTQY